MTAIIPLYDERPITRRRMVQRARAWERHDVRSDRLEQLHAAVTEKSGKPAIGNVFITNHGYFCV